MVLVYSVVFIGFVIPVFIMSCRCWLCGKSSKTCLVAVLDIPLLFETKTISGVYSFFQRADLDFRLSFGLYSSLRSDLSAQSLTS